MRNHLAQEIKSFAPKVYAESGHAGQVATRPVQAGDQPVSHRLAAVYKYDRDGRGGRLGRKCWGKCTSCDDHRHVPADQISSQCWQPSGLTISPTVFDRQISALDIARFGEARAKRSEERRVGKECRARVSTEY